MLAEINTIFAWAIVAISLIAAGAATVAMIRTAKVITVESKVDKVDSKIDKVIHEVQTKNELTLGQLGEAQETRRIQEKSEPERTSREKRHTDQSSERSTGA